jgi:hypothetical protein
MSKFFITQRCAVLLKVLPMLVERKVRNSALFTNLVGWHTGAVSFPRNTKGGSITVQLTSCLTGLESAG